MQFSVESSKIFGNCGSFLEPNVFVDFFVIIIRHLDEIIADANFLIWTFHRSNPILEIFVENAHEIVPDQII